MWKIAAIVICFCFSSLKNFSSLQDVIIGFHFHQFDYDMFRGMYVRVRVRARARSCVCVPMSCLELLELLWFVVCFVSLILQSS